MTWQTALRNDYLRAVIRALIGSQRVRQTAMRMMLRKVEQILLEEDRFGRPPQVQADKLAAVSALLRSIDRAVERGAISRHVLDRTLDIFLLDVLLGGKQRKLARETLGFRPPLFITISPTMRCNLRCEGCYATSAPDCQAKLDWDTFDRILTEMRDLWDSRFVVISGGEPFLWRDGGRDLLDMAEKHSYRFFMVYTNGTLIDKTLARRLEALGNVTPAISVEGFEAETDARRGAGVFHRILQAFEALREAGVFFGISLTATRRNWDVVTSDSLFDFYFDQHGASYAWIFQYMPIGREADFGLMVTPEQRLQMLQRMWALVREQERFIVDFWNSGTCSDGCIAAGRGAGYFYINWNGDVTPCVFIPYAAANIHEVYRQGGNLNSVLATPLFQRIRAWQHDYGFGQPGEQTGNWLCPCAIRDHFGEFLEAARACPISPIDPAAKSALADPEYHRAMIEYGREYDQLTRQMWEQEYLSGCHAPTQRRLAAG